MNKPINIEVDLVKNSKKCQDFNESLIEQEYKMIESCAMVVHKSPPKGYPKDKSQYADPERFKYPIDTKSRVLAAWRYINKSHNQKGYSPEEVAKIKGRIKSAGKKYGLDLKEGDGK